jgi:RimJ/RimL family protein N-acetyltransferase
MVVEGNDVPITAGPQVAALTTKVERISSALGHGEVPRSSTEVFRSGPELIAAAGIMRARSPKFAHRASIWGVFVEPAHRGKGLGQAVIAAAIDLARTWPGVDYIDLGASGAAPEAQRLYERLGFAAWGREPEATEIGGRRYDEIHMTLRLRPGDGRGA